MTDTCFDVVVLGTSLTQSILAAALSKAGFKVAHLDVERYYGAEEASLSLDEWIQWTDQKSSHTRYTDITRESRDRDVLSHSRYYSLSLCPSVIPSAGPIISSLISSGVSKYGGFKLLDSVGIYSHPGTVKSVPSSKEDIFKNKQLTLVDKRRIMRFLTFAMSEFEDKPEMSRSDLPFFEFVKTVFGLGEDVVEAIGYALAYCTHPTEPTLPALTRLRKYMRAAGRYGPSPFLVGHYGGTGEIAQGFCRAAAVSGAMYILGRRILSVSVGSPPDRNEPGTWSKIDVEDVPDSLFGKLIIASPSMATYLPSEWNLMRVEEEEDAEEALSMARCIAIIDFQITFASRESDDEDQDRDVSSSSPSSLLPPPPIDTGILVFPPSSLPGGSTVRAATVLVTGESAMSTPRGKSILYIALAMDPETEGRGPKEMLKPYLDATLSLSLAPKREPLLVTYYVERPHARPRGDEKAPGQTQTRCLVTPPLRNDRLPEAPDLAAIHAERVFREAVRVLRPQEPVEGLSFWPAETDLGDMEDTDEW